jgi:hypothetical protein
MNISLKFNILQKFKLTHLNIERNSNKADLIYSIIK